MKAYKFRLYPNKEQRKEMQTHLWFSKNLWNEMLDTTKCMYRDFQKFPSRTSLQLISKNSGLYSQVAQDIGIRLQNGIWRYVDFLKKKKAMKAKGIPTDKMKQIGFPRFKSIDRMKSLHYPQSGFSLTERKLDVSPFGEINIKKHREIEGEIRTLTLKRESSGKWFAIFTAETENHPVPIINNGEKIGIDLGLMTFATLSNGKKIKKPKHMKEYEDKLAFYQRELSNKKLRSKNRRKAKIKVGKIHSKVANARKDWIYKTVKNLLSRYSFIAFEDLNVQGIAEEHGKGVADAGWSIFTNIISYKAENAGCEVVFVNPENTSKDCSSCGTRVPKELWERTHNCPSCGLIMDRDLNAAINILTRATVGMTGSNACEDGTIVPSVKQEAITSA